MSPPPELETYFDSATLWLELGRSLLVSLSLVAADPLALLFSFSFSSRRTARRASWFFRSFSLRKALDSNSCQSPSRSLSLWMMLTKAPFVIRKGDTYSTACRGAGSSVVKYGCSSTSLAVGLLDGSYWNMAWINSKAEGVSLS